MKPALSIYLDLIRFFAAAIVFIDHADQKKLAGGLPVLWRFSDHGYEAVMIFFVLSGLVIGYVSDTKEKTLKDYSISRIARLYSVILPALVLTFILDRLGVQIAPDVYDRLKVNADDPLGKIVVNLFLVNELWFVSIAPLSNGVFWSLGYEFWYYAIFGAACYLPSPYRYAVTLLLCLVVGPKILILLPVWLMGAWTYYKIKKADIPESLGWLLFLGSVVAYAGLCLANLPFRLDAWLKDWLGNGDLVKEILPKHGLINSYIIASFVTLNFLGAAAISHRLDRVLGKIGTVIRYIAGFTFAGYLFHYPLLLFFASLTDQLPDDSKRIKIIVFATLATVWALGTVTEKKKTHLKRWLTLIFDRFGAGKRIAGGVR